MLVTPAPVTYTASNWRSAMMRAERALAAPGTINAERAVAQAAMRWRRDAAAAVTPELFCFPVILVFPSYRSCFAQCRDLLVVVSQSAEPEHCVLGELRRWGGGNDRLTVELKTCTGHVLRVTRRVGCPVDTCGEACDKLAPGEMGMLQNLGNAEHSARGDSSSNHERLPFVGAAAH